MPNELTIKVTREQSYGRHFIRAECLGITVDSDPVDRSGNIADEDLHETLEKLGRKIEDRHATLKKMKVSDLTEAAVNERGLLTSVLG